MDAALRELIRRLKAGDITVADEVGRLSYRYELSNVFYDRPAGTFVTSEGSIGWLPLKLAQFNSKIPPYQKQKSAVKLINVASGLGQFLDAARVRINRMAWSRVSKTYYAKGVVMTDVIFSVDFATQHFYCAVGSHRIPKSHIRDVFPDFPYGGTLPSAIDYEREAEWFRTPAPNKFRTTLLEAKILAAPFRSMRYGVLDENFQHCSRCTVLGVVGRDCIVETPRGPFCQECLDDLNGQAGRLFGRD